MSSSEQCHSLLQCWTKETAAKSNVWILFGQGGEGRGALKEAGSRGEGARGEDNENSNFSFLFKGQEECNLGTKHDGWFFLVCFGCSAYHMESTCHISNSNYIARLSM